LSFAADPHQSDPQEGVYSGRGWVF